MNIEHIIEIVLAAVIAAVVIRYLFGQPRELPEA